MSPLARNSVDAQAYVNKSFSFGLYLLPFIFTAFYHIDIIFLYIQIFRTIAFNGYPPPPRVVRKIEDLL